MIHGIRIEKGRALWYRNRWIRSDRSEQGAGRGAGRGAAPRVRHRQYQRRPASPARHWGWSKRAARRSRSARRSRPCATPISAARLHGSFTAHPHVDPLTGEMHGICYDVSRRRAIRYVVVTPEGKVRREVEIPIKHGPMIHDCAFTQRFAIILDLPVTFSLCGGDHRPPVSLSLEAVACGARRPVAARRRGRATSSGARSIPATSSTPSTAYDAADGKRHPGCHRPRPDVLQDQGRAGFATQRPRTLDRRSGNSEGRAHHDRSDAAGISAPGRTAPGPALSLRLHDGHDRLVPRSGPVQARPARPARARSTTSGRTGIPASSCSCPRMPRRRRTRAGSSASSSMPRAEATDLVILDARNFEGAPQASIRIPHIVPPGFHGNWLQDGAP